MMLAFPLFFGAFAYLILNLQLATGFPPFYVHWGEQHQRAGFKEDVIVPVLARGFWLFVGLGLVLLAAVLKTPHLAAIGAIAPACLGFLVRKNLKKEQGLPYPLLDFVRFRLPIAGPIFDRWPMLVFDVWTVGMALVIPGVMLLQAYTQ
ncbi:hypothetical protein [Ruegeria jejuensis]|uniref:hypothetical protein n=1 Tax=Ruegeria jejuensis TaxID=3233338 RepID=UPI00355BB4ED